MKSGLGFTNKPGSSGPPFPAGSAFNGLSVDPVTKKIQLGQLATGVAGAADFTMDTQTFLQGFTYSFLDDTATPGDVVRFQGNQLRFVQAATNSYFILGNQQATMFDNVLGNQVTINPTDINLQDGAGSFISVAPLLVDMNDLPNGDEVKLFPSQMQFTSAGLNVGLTIFQNAIHVFDNVTTNSTVIGINSLSLNDNVSNIQLSAVSNLLAVSDLVNGTSGQFSNLAATIFDNPSGIRSELTTQSLKLGYPGTPDGVNILSFTGAPASGAGLQIDNGLFPIFTLSETGTIRTTKPTGGVSAAGGAFQIGEVVAAAVVLDAARYVEATINGVLLKLAIVN